MRMGMALLVLSTGFFDAIVSGNSNIIPTKEEQINLLTNVQEVFEEIKILINVEGNSTAVSVITDIHKIVERARNQLGVMEELTLTKMSYSSNSVCMLDSKATLKDIIRNGSMELETCINNGSVAITECSRKLTNVTSAALKRGQDLLNTMNSCSRKAGLQVISCYKGIIAQDVVPVKKILLNAVNTHKTGHLRAIQIRDDANCCVDDIVDRYEVEIAKILKQALQCT